MFSDNINKNTHYQWYELQPYLIKFYNTNNSHKQHLQTVPT